MDILERHLRPALSPPGPSRIAEPPAAGAGALPGELWAFLAAMTALRVAYLATGILDLSPDEAHYWEWSRQLDLSYYSKGPLVAYLIRTLTTLFGTSAFAIRLGAVLLSVVASVLIYRLGRAAFADPRVGVLAVVGLQLTPLVWAGSLLLTIDAPFLVLWALALLCLYRALVGGARGAWLGAGMAVGLGLLAKYTMLFVLPGLALYLWRAPEARRAVGRPACLAALVAGGLFTPVVVWNLRHGFVSARHVVSQGMGSGLNAIDPLEFAGGQLLVLTPLVGVLLAWGLWYGLSEGVGRGREPYRFLTAFAAPILTFYLLLSFQGKIQANWPAAAYPPLALVTAGALLERAGAAVAGRRSGSLASDGGDDQIPLASHAGAPAPGRAAARPAAPGRSVARRQRRLLVAAGALALAVSVLGHATDRLGIPPRLDPTTRLKGWRELGAAVSAVRREMPAPERTFLLSDRYQIASELAFYVEGQPRAYNVNLGRRLNQYDFWESPDSRRGWDGIFVQDGLGELDGRVVQAFTRTEGPFVVEIRRQGRPIRIFALYRGYGFRGLAPSGGATTY